MSAQTSLSDNARTSQECAHDMATPATTESDDDFGDFASDTEPKSPPYHHQDIRSSCRPPWLTSKQPSYTYQHSQRGYELSQQPTQQWDVDHHAANQHTIYDRSHHQQHQNYYHGSGITGSSCQQPYRPYQNFNTPEDARSASSRMKTSWSPYPAIPGQHQPGERDVAYSMPGFLPTEYSKAGAVPCLHHAPGGVGSQRPTQHQQFSQPGRAPATQQFPHSGSNVSEQYGRDKELGGVKCVSDNDELLSEDAESEVKEELFHCDKCRQDLPAARFTRKARGERKRFQKCNECAVSINAERRQKTARAKADSQAQQNSATQTPVRRAPVNTPVVQAPADTLPRNRIPTKPASSLNQAAEKVEAYDAADEHAPERLSRSPSPEPEAIRWDGLVCEDSDTSMPSVASERSGDVPMPSVISEQSSIDSRRPSIRRSTSYESMRTLSRSSSNASMISQMSNLEACRQRARVDAREDAARRKAFEAQRNIPEAKAKWEAAEAEKALESENDRKAFIARLFEPGRTFVPDLLRCNDLVQEPEGSDSDDTKAVYYLQQYALAERLDCYRQVWNRQKQEHKVRAPWEKQVIYLYNASQFEILLEDEELFPWEPFDVWLTRCYGELTNGELEKVDHNPKLDPHARKLHLLAELKKFVETTPAMVEQRKVCIQETAYDGLITLCQNNGYTRNIIGDDISANLKAIGSIFALDCQRNGCLGTLDFRGQDSDGKAANYRSERGMPI